MRRRPTVSSFVAWALAAAAGAAAAQPATPPAAAPGASAVRPGPRPGMGPRSGADSTPGWAMMSPAERDAHRRQMQGARTADECRQIRDEHHKRMTERAKARGAAGMPGPRRDACAAFQP